MIVFAVMMISANNGALPAENVILARYVPRSRRSLAFGFKFVLAIGFATLGVQLEAVLFDNTGEFYWLYMLLSGISLAGAFAVLILPGDRQSNATPQPAE